MVSSRASGLVIVHSLVLVGIGCAENGGVSTEPSFGNVGGSVSGAGGSSSGANRTSGGTSNIVGSTMGTGGNNATGNSPTSGGSNALGGTSTTGGSKTTGGVSSTGTSKTTGGTTASGGSKTTGGTSSTGTSKTTGGATAAGDALATGGSKSTGGAAASGGSKTTGGTSSTGTSKTTGGASTTGGALATGGASATGGSKSTGGMSSTGGSASSGSCTFTVTPGVSSKMATVGTVDWSTSSTVSSAQIVYSLNNAASGVLNKGGTAPVDLTTSNYHTLLSGLKQSSTYTFHIEATLSNGSTCKSSDYTVTTGSLSGAPSITRTATNASAQANGFIVTSTGLQGSGAYIIDADGAVVWYSTAPSQCSRARMDYEGANMWMLALNVRNGGGEMRFVSMDGQTSKTSISGLSGAHHDFTVVPHKIAAMVWASTGTDPESNLVEMASDGSGSATTVFKIGSNLYVGGSGAMGGGSNTYHCNSILYYPSDDSFTIGDRNPNLYVKVSHSGAIQWQLGGSCTNAPAGASKCVAESWKVNHGHHLLSNGNFLVFNNGQSGASHVFDYTLNTSGSTMSAASVKDFTSGSTSSNVLGDVQRLPNGNTLVTYSTAGQILEVDTSWATVQTLKGSFGYADWRETLYGAPPR